MSSLFSGIGQAKAPSNSNYLRDGGYWVQVIKCQVKPDRKHVPMFVMDARIIKVLTPGAHQVGEEACHLVKSNSDYFLPEIKGILMAATGMAQDEISEELCSQAVGDDNPLSMVVLEYQGVEIEPKDSTPDNHKVFTRRFYKRSVPFAELNEGLDDETKARFFGASFDWAGAIKAEAGDA